MKRLLSTIAAAVLIVSLPALAQTSSDTNQNLRTKPKASSTAQPKAGQSIGTSGTSIDDTTAKARSAMASKNAKTNADTEQLNRQEIQRFSAGN
jgi:hypothetical protein